MKTVKLNFLSILACLVWGCSDSSSSPGRPANADTSPGEKPSGSMEIAKQNYESLRAGVMRSCGFETDSVVTKGKNCKVGSYPTQISQQIDLLEKSFLPALDAYIVSAKEANYPALFEEIEQEYFIEFLAKLKTTQTATGKELATHAKELETLEENFQILADELNTLGCDVKDAKFSCPAPQSVSPEDTARLIGIQNKIYRAQQLLEKINALYGSMKYNNIEDYENRKNMGAAAKKDNKDLSLKIDLAYSNQFNNLVVAIKEKAKNYFEDFQLSTITNEEFAQVKALDAKIAYGGKLSAEDFLFYGRIETQLEKFLAFLTTEEALIRSKVITHLEIDSDLKFSQYSEQSYNLFPEYAKFKVTMPLNTPAENWVKHFQSLDDAENNPFFIKRDKKIEEINAFTLKFKQAESRDRLPVFVDISIERLKKFGVEQVLQTFQAIEEVYLKDPEMLLYPLLYPKLTGKEQIRILYLEGFDSFPTSTPEVVVFGIKRSDVNLGKQNLSFNMSYHFSKWSEQFRK